MLRAGRSLFLGKDHTNKAVSDSTPAETDYVPNALPLVDEDHTNNAVSDSTNRAADCFPSAPPYNPSTVRPTDNEDLWLDVHRKRQQLVQAQERQVLQRELYQINGALNRINDGGALSYDGFEDDDVAWEGSEEGSELGDYDCGGEDGDSLGYHLSQINTIKSKKKKI